MFHYCAGAQLGRMNTWNRSSIAGVRVHGRGLRANFQRRGSPIPLFTFSPRAVPFARHTLVFTVIGWFFEAFSWWSSTAGVRVHGRGFRLPSSGVVHPLCRSRDKLCSPWGLYIFARLGPAWLRGWVGCLIGPEPYPTPPPQGSGFDHQKSPPPHLISTYPFIRLVVERRGSIWAGVFLGRFPPPPPKSDFLYGKTLPPHL